jgi:glucosylceramidase
MAHFSKYIRPGAVRIGFENPDPSLMITAAKNPDGTIAVVVLNMNPESKNIKLILGDRLTEVQISARAIQTIVVSL